MSDRPSTSRGDAPDSGAPEIVVDVRQDVDAFLARANARELARRSGFNRREVEEIALVATELATNILRHAIRGKMHMSSVRDVELGPGIRIVAIDSGPPIRSFETALLDGHDDRGPVDWTLKRKGIAGGLGCVRRLSHSVTHDVRDGGNVISVARWVCAPGKKRA